MLLSNRQRLVAETGLLTLLGWMAVTIAFNKPPRQSMGSATELPSLLHARPGTVRDAAPPEPAPSQAGDQASLPPSAASTDGRLFEPKVVLPRDSKALATGTVIRMGAGVEHRPDPTVPEQCLTRSATGTSRLGPVP